jgi:hypothetical protein
MTILRGVRPFTIRGYPRADPETVMADLRARIAPALEARGYRITQRADGRLRFELERRRGLLRRKRHEAVMIDVDEGGRGTQVVATGVAPRAVRRLLRDLGD